MTRSRTLAALTTSVIVTDYTLATNVLTMDVTNGNIGFIGTAP